MGDISIGLCGTWGLVEGSPIGVAEYLCPLPCPEVAPEMGLPGYPWFGSGSDGSPGGALGDNLLGGTGDGATGWPYRSCLLGGWWIRSSWLVRVHPCRVSTCLTSPVRTLSGWVFPDSGVEPGRLGPI